MVRIAIVVAAVPWAAWTTRQTMKLWVAIAEIRKRQDAREVECAGRLDWLRKMDEKLDTVAEGVARINGLMDGDSHWSRRSP